MIYKKLDRFKKQFAKIQLLLQTYTINFLYLIRFGSVLPMRFFRFSSYSV